MPLIAIITAGMGELGTAAAAAAAETAAAATAASAGAGLAGAGMTAAETAAPAIMGAAGSTAPGIAAVAPEAMGAVTPAGIAQGAAAPATALPPAAPGVATLPGDVTSANTAFGAPNVNPASAANEMAQAASSTPADIMNATGIAAPEAPALSGLQGGIKAALEFTKNYPLATQAGITAAGQVASYLSRPGSEPEKGPSKRKDMSGFSASTPSTVAYNPVYQPTQYYAVGGPVEQMSAQNALGDNTMYPQAGINTSMYSNPQVQRPMANPVISAGGDMSVDPYTGEQRFASGGGVKNYSEMVAAQDQAEQAKTQANQEALDAYSKREMNKGVVTDSDIDTYNKDPMNAAVARLNKLNKRVGIKSVAAPQSKAIDSGVFHAAQGGIMHNLGGYSDGGRLLKGPGDGVSDSIPATIGAKQPARLADGEFVIPARIVSEIGNGSTDAGARKLYAMMERVQADRKKSIGKDKVAVNSKADKHLPK